MFRPVINLLTSLPLAALPTFAAEAEVPTGITSVGPAIFIFTIAGALLLTLVLRSGSSYVARVVTTRLGRWRVKRTLDRLGTYVLHDFILPGAYGGLVRIEHAILTAGGILCLQTKHYNGVVFGEADDAQWANVDGVNRQRFLNPLIQGEGRRRALQNIVSEVPVANVVVFTGAIEFMGALPNNVIHVRELENTIENLALEPGRIDDWEALWLTLKAASRTDVDSRKDYAAQLSFG